ncbi:hypothetical protein [Pandoraea anhela]|uniref:Uncharacterized protein n=1 Tax=Pandoraea anhela TaxID=2508295 RepID=A0A5E4YGJ7_9BURK|nr:hypothetical protein [Pandoraea anhela]VVE47173.1 hypothetical protein PAN31108_04478 [Pandoraea anhela]
MRQNEIILGDCRVVCAACRFSSNPPMIILGARHWDPRMHETFEALQQLVSASIIDHGRWEQGFIDQFGKFLSRTEAWKVAEAAGQIIRRCGGDEADGGTLYSENLY